LFKVIFTARILTSEYDFKIELKKKGKNETLNGLDDVSMDGPDSLLFINCGDIFAESILFSFFVLDFVSPSITLLCKHGY